ncbi:hypothetical protein [Streptomyces sp. URMC 124]|uniref:hypothetical protein n=1 Tax=Streptomyces sp. URMC 124 TaxID=3423405 RepID=UPI003F1BCDD8
MTGVLFDAIQIPQELLTGPSAADRDAVEERYREARVTSAVIADPAHRYHYALVRPGSGQLWGHDACSYFGPAHSIAVPAPHRGDPPGVHWLLSPPDGPGALCDVARLSKLVARVGG